MKPLSFRKEDTPVVAKTKELCQTILDQSAYQEMRHTIEEFLSNATVRAQYNHLCNLQEALQHKHGHGEEITESDMIEFQREEAAFLDNPVAQGFINAQRAMQKIEATVSAYIRKTFELGRLPAEDEVSTGGCGCGGSGSCGCG